MILWPVSKGEYRLETPYDLGTVTDSRFPREINAMSIRGKALPERIVLRLFGNENWPYIAMRLFADERLPPCGN
jgi:hypothetical protein